MAYDPALALKCAELSAHVYLEPEQSVLDDPDQHFVDESGTQVWLINKPDAVFVVFRGTSYEDLKTDLKVRKEKTDFGKIHRGFLGYVDAVNFRILQKLYEWDWAMTKPVILTGHSLGAAAAVIEACYLNELGFNISGVYTFGEPRIGNRQFASYADEAFGDCHYRHVNGHDGVPMIPLILWYYWHCGQRFYFSITHQRLVRNAPLCQIVLERLPVLLKTPWRWALSKKIDHSVFLYVSGCERNL